MPTILVNPLTRKPGHYSAEEFARAQEKVGKQIDPDFQGVYLPNIDVLTSLERVHEDLESHYGCVVYVTITDALRNILQLLWLGKKYGWIGEDAPDGSPGRVARDSEHLRGTAVDLKAHYYRDGKRINVPMEVLFRIVDRYFVLTLLYNTHVHGDMRKVLNNE